MFFSFLNQPYDIIRCVYWFELFSQVSDVANGPFVLLPFGVLKFGKHVLKQSILRHGSRFYKILSHLSLNIFCRCLKRVGSVLSSSELDPFLHTYVVSCTYWVTTTVKSAIYSLFTCKRNDINLINSYAILVLARADWWLPQTE